MTRPSVVILTDPANCELADGQLLLQALVQAQELSREGVPVSQAFCDNPAAAQGFIDAYTSAYPELQLQSPDLPLPEQLYSMMVDGRLAPLPDLNLAPDGTKLESADKLYPLVVLSLGAPDALMEAFQDNRFVNGRINVIEIAPIDQSQSTAVPVAATVGARAIAGPSLSPDTSTSSISPEGEEAPSEALANALLKLDSAEFRLSETQLDDDREQAQRTQPEAAIVDTTPVISAADTNARQGAHADAPVGDSGNPTSPASQPGPGLDPAARSTAAPAPTGLIPAAPELTGVTATTAEPIVASGRSSEQAETSPDQGVAAGAPPQSSGDDAESPSRTPAGSGPGESLLDTTQVLDGPGETTAPLTSAADRDTTDRGEENLAPGGSSFSEPGEDFVYPPTSSFTSDDDVTYRLPLVAVPESNDFGGLLGMSMADDIVDLEAISAGSADHTAVTTEPFDPILMRAGGPHGLGAQDVHGPSSRSADPGHLDRPTPDPDDHQDEMITPVHDLDI